MRYPYTAKALFIFFSLSNTVVLPAQEMVQPPWKLNSNIYEVNLRQYSPAGTFRAFEKQLPRLKKMGVEILSFAPVSTSAIEAKKNITDQGAVKDYTAVNKEFGSLEDWIALVKHAHSLGFRIIIGWVANHSSPDNIWTQKHPSFYLKDGGGNMVGEAGYTSTRKLNYANTELRDSMISAMKFWVTSTGVDGFRCDLSDRPPLDFWRQAIAALRKVKNVFMLADSENPAFYLAGFDQTYASGVMEAMSNLCTGKQSLAAVDSVIQYNKVLFPKNALRLYFTSSQDWNSRKGTEFDRYGEAHKAMAVFSQTMVQGTPLIYSGQEAANKKRLKSFPKDTIAWGKYELAPFYTTLLQLRRNTPALASDASYKKLATANDMAIFAYQREKAGEKISVILNLSPQPQRFTINDTGIYGKSVNVFSGGKEILSREHVFNMEPWGYLVYSYY